MIRQNVRKILKVLPEGVLLVAASKRRSAEEILQVVEAGARIIGENYCAEARRAYVKIGKKALWHYIGIPSREKHDLLRKKSLEIFDMIETVDSVEIAREIDRKCRDIGKVMSVLIEVNSGKERQKSGVFPEDTRGLVEKISLFENVKIMGLMTMGPRAGLPEDSRSYFQETKKLFDEISELNIKNVEMKYLSMGMSNSYLVAIEEGANMIRIGTKIYEDSKQ
ncbi:YggS family pyridoxal phosphate-dependent enzyme [candidate division WOR-3 bacterium]|nr:YggS family pyridoxal phosphate-dependent enzyme [candidate division WOR-3 bacterium]